MKNFLSLIFSVVLIRFSYQRGDWIAEDLAKNYTIINRIVDPDSYLSKTETQLLQIELERFETKTFYDISLIIIASMNGKYLRIMKKDINLFLSDLSYALYKGDRSKDDKSLIILLSIDDRQVKIRTGGLVKKSISDTQCSTIIEKIKTNMREKYYFDAALKIFRELNSISNDSSSMLVIYIIGAIAFVFVVYIACLICNKIFKNGAQRSFNTIEPYRPIENDLNRESEIIALENKIQFLERTYNSSLDIASANYCLLCLEPFLNAPTVNETKQEMLLNNNLFTLNCGHYYHSPCYTRWTNLHPNEQCGVCFHRVTDQRLAYIIFNLQRSQIPTLDQYELKLNQSSTLHILVRKELNAGGYYPNGGGGYYQNNNNNYYESSNYVSVYPDVVIVPTISTHHIDTHTHSDTPTNHNDWNCNSGGADGDW